MANFLSRWFGKKTTTTPKEPVKPKSVWREWLDALVFAGIAAIIIRTFIFEAYVIPTSSMERSLMVGDFLFVSKFHYGIRMPMAPLSIPFIHNRIPGTNVRSYVDGVELPYYRIPGLTEIKRNDPIVFNYPADDVAPIPPGSPTHRIPSMKENYIKRCIALPGDTIRIDSQRVYINGTLAINPPEAQFNYDVLTNGEDFNYKRSLEKLGFRPEGHENANYFRMGNQHYVMSMTDEVADEVRKFDNVKEVSRKIDAKGVGMFDIYPNNYGFRWNRDNFGPLVVPKRGLTIPLDSAMLSVYRRPIEGYEHHKIERRGKEILVDGKPATTYTFEMDYYIGMGDNRYNSLDSRFWGFIPENHIVGKPMFVLLSFEGGLRWNRFFKGIE